MDKKVERTELITHLEHLAEYVKYSEDAPALREAIALLKTHEERTETHVCDLIQPDHNAEVSKKVGDDSISRHEAIDEIRKCRFLVDAIKKIRGLPPAQPDIIRCRDCRHWRSNTEFCSTFTELNVAHRMPPNGFCSCAEKREE